MATETNNSNNTYWNLEDFVDSLVVELDKTRETLAIKAINKQLTYTVKDLAIDLNIFPTFDGDNIKFITAHPKARPKRKPTRLHEPEVYTAEGCLHK
jgi:hypothetical protein